MKMKIINCEQGGDEWFSIRLGKATASNFSKIVTSKGVISKTIDRYALDLASEALIVTPEEGYSNEAMQHGNEQEPIAREMYQEKTLSIVEEVGFIDCGEYGCSPDGLIGDDGAIEIKCPSAAIHTDYLSRGKLPTKYYQQVQGVLFVTNRLWCDFVSFNPNFPEELQIMIVRVDRDLDFIDLLSQGMAKVIDKKKYILNEINSKHIKKG